MSLHRLPAPRVGDTRGRGFHQRRVAGFGVILPRAAGFHWPKRPGWQAKSPALFMQTAGKLLPRGLLDQVSAEVGVSRREIQFRVKFANKYPTEDELCNALHSWQMAEGRGGRKVQDLTPVDRCAHHTHIAAKLRFHFSFENFFQATKGNENADINR